MNPVYVYFVEIAGQPAAPFSWPNVAKKFIRDTYSTDGELHLPPDGRLTITRYKLNPKAGQAIIIERYTAEKFLNA